MNIKSSDLDGFITVFGYPLTVRSISIGAKLKYVEGSLRQLRPDTVTKAYRALSGNKQKEYEFTGEVDAIDTIYRKYPGVTYEDILEALRGYYENRRDNTEA